MLRIPFSTLKDEEVVRLASGKLGSKLEDWEKKIWQFISDWFNPSVDSIKIYTSGSTGTPKEILHGKGSVLNSARLTCEALNLQAGDQGLLCLPVDKISGMMVIVRISE